MGHNGFLGQTLSSNGRIWGWVKGMSKSHQTLDLVPKGAVSMIIGIGIFSFFGNLLLLSGPLYMLQIYDRVLATRSVETLLGLSVITAFLLLTWGVLDFSRGRVLARLGSEFRSRFDQCLGLVPQSQRDRFRDVSRTRMIAWADSAERLVSPPIGAALADAIWAPIFLVGLAFFHPLMCLLACVAIAGTVGIQTIGHWIGRARVEEARGHGFKSDQIASQIDAAGATSLRTDHHRNLWRHWFDIRVHAVRAEAKGADIQGAVMAVLRTWKLCAQSAMLGLGAYLVLQAGLSPGAMVAATILLARASAPLDVLSAQWPVVVDAGRSLRALATILAQHPLKPDTIPVKEQSARVLVSSLRLSVASDSNSPPLNFEIQPGETLGVIGAFGSGKTELLRALQGLTGAARACQNTMFVSAEPQIFTGSIAQNISGFRTEAKAAQILNAAKAAGLADDVAKLDEGFNSDVDVALSAWPKAMRYRLALAHAIYDSPPVLLLDDPFNGQPPEGVHAIAALCEARSKAGKTTIFTARHPTALGSVHKLLWLDKGQNLGFGPRDSVLARFLAPRASQEPATQLDLAS